MSTKYILIRRLLVTLVIASLLLGPTSNVFADGKALPLPVSPPFGPPITLWPDDNYQDLYSSEYHDFKTQQSLTPLVKIAIDDLVTHYNADPPSEKGFRAVVKSWSFDYLGSPYMDATQYTDQPNERFVNISYGIVLNLDIQKSIGDSWVTTDLDRSIHQPLHLEISCDKWHTHSGQILVTAKPGKPYPGNGTGNLEKILNVLLLTKLTPFIDSKIRANLNKPLASSSVTPPVNTKCDTIGANGHEAGIEDDTVIWSKRKVLSQTNLHNQILLKLISVKRLKTHSFYDEVIYDEIESPIIDLYTNYDHTFINLPALQEEQEVMVDSRTLMVTRPADGEFLVIVANLVYLKDNRENVNSSFVALTSKTNFGSGIQKLTVPKSYWVDYNPDTGAHPYEIRVGGYELTFQVTVHKAGSNW